LAQPRSSYENDKRFCANCGGMIDTRAEFCPTCGVRVTPAPYPPVPPPSPYVERKNEGIAAILSFVFLGLGQIYNGQISKGISFIIIGVLFVFSMLFLIGFLLYPLFWMYNIYDAYNTAKQINAGLIHA
jgi:TM2 domain-containing membrane protein YozV